MSTSNSRERRHIPLLAFATVVSLLLGACAAPSPSTSQQTNTITVTAHASVDVIPDTASFSVAITAEADDAETAHDAIVQPTNDVLDCLKKHGVADEDIQTVYTDVSPTWSEDKETYEGRTVLNITNVAVDDVPALMDACLDAGATEVNGPEYYAVDAEEAYMQALADAVEAARPKAEAIAQASGVALGEIVSVDEGYENTRYYKEEAAATSDVAADGGVPIEPGQVSVEAEVTVSFAIK